MAGLAFVSEVVKLCMGYVSPFSIGLFSGRFQTWMAIVQFLQLGKSIDRFRPLEPDIDLKLIWRTLRKYMMMPSSQTSSAFSKTCNLDCVYVYKIA